VIRIAGRTLYPHHIEDSVRDAHALLRPGCVIACAVDNDREPGLAVLAEINAEKLAVTLSSGIIQAIRQRVLEEHGETCALVWLGRPGSLPKTTSGKLMRARCRERLASTTAGNLPGTVYYVSTPARRRQPRLGINVLRHLGSER
jgi:acyl-CoA synthetase (AMP-forming)/AMP-acid ligase II